MYRIICKAKEVLSITDHEGQRVSRGIALPFHDVGAWMGLVGQHQSPADLPSGKTRYPLYRRVGGPQGRSGRGRKISPAPGFDPRTVKPVASCYTDWAIPVLIEDNYWNKLSKKSRYVGSYYANISRCTVHITSNVSQFSFCENSEFKLIYDVLLMLRTNFHWTAFCYYV